MIYTTISIAVGKSTNMLVKIVKNNYASKWNKYIGQIFPATNNHYYSFKLIIPDEPNPVYFNNNEIEIMQNESTSATPRQVLCPVCGIPWCIQCRSCHGNVNCCRIKLINQSGTRLSAEQCKSRINTLRQIRISQGKPVRPNDEFMEKDIQQIIKQ
jgi:hypothetical protein